MKAVLVSIEGTIEDTRARHSLIGTPDYYKREELAKDAAVPDSVRCLRELAQRYTIVYTCVRPADALAATQAWLSAKSFPDGPVFLASTHAEHLALIRDLKTRYDFAAGVGVTSDDNELHLELGCLSILLKEFEGNWDTVRKHLLGREHSALQTANKLLEPLAKDVKESEPHRLDIILAADDLIPAVAALTQTQWGYLSAITGLDHLSAGNGEKSGAIEVLYHFCSGAAVVNLRVSLPREHPSIHSVCSMIPAATFFERALRAAGRFRGAGRADVALVAESLGDVRVRLGEFEAAGDAYRL